MKTQLILISFILLGLCSVAIAQDTLKLNLRQAEKQFVAENYQLIAQQYETEMAKAEVITAKLFDNPELSYENLFYNHETKRFLETSAATGQYSASIAQLIRLARKRNKNIQLANEGVRMSSYAYFDLMRNLRFELRSTFYKSYYTQRSASVYAEQITAMEQLLLASEKQLELGNTALKDVIRIKSLLYALRNEHTKLLNELEDLQARLKLMIHAKANSTLELSLAPDEERPLALPEQNYVSLLDSAKTNRADLQLAKANLSYAEKNLRLQQANAIPDVELSLSYDLKGNYPEKYTGLGIRVPLPLFNRNQGEIKKARIAIAAGSSALEQQEAQLENEVYNSYRTVLRTESTYQGMDQRFSADFEQLIHQLTRNFKSRNISLMEFLDLYDSYRENILQLNELRYERMNAKEELNYVTGSSLFKNQEQIH